MSSTVISKGTEIRFNIKDFISVTVFITTIASLYFSMKSEITEAKELPKPVVTRDEFLYRDKVVDAAIIQTQKDISDIKESLKILEERVYQNK